MQLLRQVHKCVQQCGIVKLVLFGGLVGLIHVNILYAFGLSKNGKKALTLTLTENGGDDYFINYSNSVGEYFMKYSSSS